MTAPPRAGRPGCRVLFSGGLNVGGPQTHLLLLCRVLVEAGAKVTVACASTNWPDEALERLRAMGVRVVVSPFGFGRLQFLGKAWAMLTWPFLLARDFDVMCCIGEGRMHLWTRRFVRRGGRTIYHEIVECPRPGSVAAEVAAKMDAIIANSGKVGRDIAAQMPGKPVRAIPFLTSEAPARPVEKRTPGPELRVAFLGRLVSHKRPAELIEAWREWTSAFGLARLDLYGGDYNGEAARLRLLIEKHGMASSIRLRGTYKTDELPRIFAATDLVVLPSLYEGLPLVLVEAMQHGVPIVATSAGGTAELGEDNPDVIVTEGTDWDAFATGLKTMVQRIRADEVDHERLQRWTESRYGHAAVARAWREALLQPQQEVAHG